MWLSLSVREVSQLHLLPVLTQSTDICWFSFVGKNLSPPNVLGKPSELHLDGGQTEYVHTYRAIEFPRSMWQYQMNGTAKTTGTRQSGVGHISSSVFRRLTLCQSRDSVLYKGFRFSVSSNVQIPMSVLPLLPPIKHCILSNNYSDISWALLKGRLTLKT